MKQIYKKLILIVFLLFSANQINAQIDTVFWFSAPWVTPDHHWRDPMAFHFSTFGNPTTVRIEQPVLGYDTTINIPANSLFSKEVDFMIDNVESKPADMLLNTGFKITSDFPITVVYDVITRAPQYFNPETFSLKGQNGMGTEFVTPFQTRWNNRTLNNDVNSDGQITQPYQQINIVATEDNTVVYITPRCNVVGHPANVTYSVTLPVAGNTYTVQNAVQNTSAPGNNLAGSIVVSDKPISVTVTDDSVNPSGGGGCFDLMGDQIVPTDVIGNEYVVLDGFLNNGSEESMFITATENFTTVTIDDGTVSTVILNQGDTYRYQLAQPSTYITSDKDVYVLHMTGYGCELGEALLPPLNCAGSDIVTFPRTNPQAFSLNILCPAGSEGGFELNGDPALVPSTTFNPVPGTAGDWLAAQITFSTADIPSNSSNILTNSIDNFAMGIINGGNTTGCLYHYMSSFIRKVVTDAGQDTTLCNGNPSVSLTGSVSGGTTTGMWSVLDGTGTLNTPTNLSTTYVPSPGDYNQGFLTFELVSTGNCDPIRDTMRVDFIQSPEVEAGVGGTYCKNNIGAAPVSGTVSFASGGSWSGGNGGAFSNPGSLSTAYTPSPADLNEDSVILYLNSAGSFFSCPSAQDSIIVYFTEPPAVSAGADQVVCSTEGEIDLNGLVTGATSTGIWSTTGIGSYSPTASNVATQYLVDPTDTLNATMTFVLSSTNNGSCLAEEDSIQVTFISEPLVQITSQDTICSNSAVLDLEGAITNGFTPLWTTSGTGNIIDDSGIPTQYTISQVDTVVGFIDFFLTSAGGTCPSVEDSMRVHFISTPEASAGPDVEFCENQLVELNGSISGNSNQGTWSSMGTGSFTSGNTNLSTTYLPSAQDLANGSVNIILTTAGVFGCPPNSDQLTIDFLTPPVANFNATTACEGSTTVFDDLSTVGNGSVNSWEWDFGDASSSLNQSPNHLYIGDGSYTVSMIVGADNGCYDTTQQVVTVNPVPVAIFGPSTACENNPVGFVDMSFISGGSIAQWSYDFGGGDILTEQYPEYNFQAEGNYPVTLTVTSNLGCTDDTLVNVFVNGAPTAAFTYNPNPALVLEDVQFNDESMGDSLSWLWDFGDGQGDNDQFPTHGYGDGGEFLVTLTVTDDNGCIDTAQRIVVIALPPVLPTGFTPNGDGENDVFIIRGGPFNKVNFNVYNNWGELIYSADKQEEGWDGTYNGENAPVGVYTWTFVVELSGDKVIKKSGDVTLIR